MKKRINALELKSIKKDYSKALRNTYNLISGKSLKIAVEDFDVVKTVHSCRLYWKPEKIKTLLLAESHVFTSNVDARHTYANELQRISKICNYPAGFVRFVYCLAYGENYLLNGASIPSNPGTWQFWNLFNETCNNRFMVSNKSEPNPKARINQKISLLKEMKEKGIWLLDCSILGLYDQGRKPNKFDYTNILNISFENYCKPIILNENPDKIIVIGKTVYDLISRNFSRIVDDRWDWIHQPNAIIKKSNRKSLINRDKKPLCVQLNHPGNEKKYRNSSTKGFRLVNNLIIREWNNDPCHYRKFIRNKGSFIDNLKSKPNRGNLLFWGEWEGNSIFYPMNNSNNIPNGVHEPFHSIANRGIQNTDPYVYGEYFKYATCSQRGILSNLNHGSLILFGTTMDEGFALDTVFVIENCEPANVVFANRAKNYSITYREETLDQLGNEYLGPEPSETKRIYHGQTWKQNKNYFSYVPCKLSGENGYKKAILKFPWLTKQKVGHPFRHLLNKDVHEIWQDVTDYLLKEKYVLGIHFEEPGYNNILDSVKSGTVKYRRTC